MSRVALKEGIMQALTDLDYEEALSRRQLGFLLSEEDPNDNKQHIHTALRELRKAGEIERIIPADVPVAREVNEQGTIIFNARQPYTHLYRLRREPS